MYNESKEWAKLQANLKETMDWISEEMMNGNYNKYCLPDIFKMNQEYFHNLIDNNYPESIGSPLNAQLKKNVDRFLAGKNLDQWNELMDVRLNNLNITLEEFTMHSQSINALYNDTWASTESSFMTNAMGVAQRLDSYTKNIPASQQKNYAFQYVCTHDSLVRPSHEALDGATYEQDDAFWDTYMPPWDYNCRCTVKLVRIDTPEVNMELMSDEKLNKSRETGDLPPNGLSNNIKKTGEFFTDEHPYISRNDVDMILAMLKKYL